MYLTPGFRGVAITRQPVSCVIRFRKEPDIPGQHAQSLIRIGIWPQVCRLCLPPEATSQPSTYHRDQTLLMSLTCSIRGGRFALFVTLTDQHSCQTDNHRWEQGSTPKSSIEVNPLIALQPFRRIKGLGNLSASTWVPPVSQEQHGSMSLRF